MLTGNDIRKELEFINRLYAFNLSVSDRRLAQAITDEGKEEARKELAELLKEKKTWTG